ncbi:MAG: hypothetical protein WCF04_02205 [Candidatus Nanopelagicales bacterium]
MTGVLVAACLLVLGAPVGAASAAPAPQASAAAAATAPAAAVSAASRKPRASVTATLGTATSGKPRVEAHSNARKVKVAYRTAKGKKHSVTRKLRSGAVRVTLPRGARSIGVRALATKKLAASKWVVAAAPVAAPTAEPPATQPTAAPTAPAPALPTPVGYDVSWPQCGKLLPSGQAFGIVGVNGGLANNTNPCLATQLTWANASSGQSSQPRAALYANTANPGRDLASWWPTTNEYPVGSPIANPYGTCTGADGAACAFVYGYAKAYDNATIRGVSNPASFIWWLDVETENSWTGDKAANRAVIEGMTHYYRDVLHAAGVGIYSTGYQWTKIMGNLGPVTSGSSPAGPSNLNGLPSWIAGATTLEGAQANCRATPLTGGRVTVTQYLKDDLDHNYACP